MVVLLMMVKVVMCLKLIMVEGFEMMKFCIRWGFVGCCDGWCW